MLFASLLRHCCVISGFACFFFPGTISLSYENVFACCSPLLFSFCRRTTPPVSACLLSHSNSLVGFSPFRSFPLSGPSVLLRTTFPDPGLRRLSLHCLWSNPRSCSMTVTHLCTTDLLYNTLLIKLLLLLIN